MSGSESTAPASMCLAHKRTAREPMRFKDVRRGRVYFRFVPFECSFFSKDFDCETSSFSPS